MVTRCSGAGGTAAGKNTGSSAVGVFGGDRGDQDRDAQGFVIVDGMLMRTDRVSMVTGRDPRIARETQETRGERAGHRRASRSTDRGLTGVTRRPSRHGHGTGTRPHRRPDHRRDQVIADSAYRGAGANVEVPQRRRAREGDLDDRPRLSANQKAVNSAHAQLRGPGEHANAQLKAGKRSAAPRMPTPHNPARPRRADPHPRRLNSSGKGSLWRGRSAAGTRSTPRGSTVTTVER